MPVCPCYQLRLFLRYIKFVYMCPKVFLIFNEVSLYNMVSYFRFSTPHSSGLHFWKSTIQTSITSITKYIWKQFTKNQELDLVFPDIFTVLISIPTQRGNGFFRLRQKSLHWCICMHKMVWEVFTQKILNKMNSLLLLANFVFTYFETGHISGSKWTKGLLQYAQYRADVDFGRPLYPMVPQAFPHKWTHN